MEPQARNRRRASPSTRTLSYWLLPIWSCPEAWTWLRVSAMTSWGYPYGWCGSTTSIPISSPAASMFCTAGRPSIPNWPAVSNLRRLTSGRRKFHGYRNIQLRAVPEMEIPLKRTAAVGDEPVRRPGPRRGLDERIPKAGLPESQVVLYRRIQGCERPGRRRQARGLLVRHTAASRRAVRIRRAPDARRTRTGRKDQAQSGSRLRAAQRRDGAQSGQHRDEAFEDRRKSTAAIPQREHAEAAAEEVNAGQQSGPDSLPRR